MLKASILSYLIFGREDQVHTKVICNFGFHSVATHVTGQIKVEDCEIIIWVLYILKLLREVKMIPLILQIFQMKKILWFPRDRPRHPDS